MLALARFARSAPVRDLGAAPRSLRRAHREPEHVEPRLGPDPIGDDLVDRGRRRLPTERVAGAGHLAPGP